MQKMHTLYPSNMCLSPSLSHTHILSLSPSSTHSLHEKHKHLVALFMCERVTFLLKTRKWYRPDCTDTRYVKKKTPK